VAREPSPKVVHGHRWCRWRSPGCVVRPYAYRTCRGKAAAAPAQAGARENRPAALAGLSNQGRRAYAVAVPWAEEDAGRPKKAVRPQSLATDQRFLGEKSLLKYTERQMAKPAGPMMRSWSVSP